jgi:hypothetical protein
MGVVQQDRAGLAGHAIVIHMCSQAGADAPLEYCTAVWLAVVKRRYEAKSKEKHGVWDPMQ